MRPLRASLRASLLALGAALLIGCGGEGESPSAADAPPAAQTPPQTPVEATLEGQGFDRDGDGRVDTWRQVDPNTGETVVARDTDGDGVADELDGVETSPDAPPGLNVPDQPLQELDGPPPPPASADDD